MTRPQRWSCWPRGRKTWTASSRQFQATKASWLDSQGKDGTRTAFTEMATAVVKTKEEKRRWRRLGTYSAAQKLKEATTELRRQWLENRGKERGKRRRLWLKRMARKLKEATTKPFPSPARRPDGHARDWKQAEARRRCSASGEHCSSKLQVCHTPKFTNYSQIFITTQKSPKTKVVQNWKFYNFASITIS